MVELTEKQRAEGEAVVKAGCKVAEPVGSMCPLWDPIFDMEALLKGRSPC